MIVVLAAAFAGVALAAVVGLIASRERRPKDVAPPKTSSGGFVLLLQIVAIIVGVSTMVTLLGGVFAAGMSLSVAIASVVPVLRDNKKRSQQKDFLEPWPDALRTIRVGLLSGQSLHQALERMSETGPEPLRPAWVRYSKIAGAVGQQEALFVLADEFEHPLTDRIFEVLATGFGVGTKIVVETIGEMIESVTEEITILSELESMTLEGRIQAVGLSVVPSLMLLYLTTVMSGYQDFYRGTFGVALVVFGSVVTLIGSQIVSALSQMKPEPRVLASGGMS